MRLPLSSCFSLGSNLFLPAIIHVYNFPTLRHQETCNIFLRVRYKTRRDVVYADMYGRKTKQKLRFNLDLRHKRKIIKFLLLETVSAAARHDAVLSTTPAAHDITVKLSAASAKVVS